MYRLNSEDLNTVLGLNVYDALMPMDYKFGVNTWSMVT